VPDEVFDFGSLKKLLSDVYKKYADLAAFGYKVPNKVELRITSPRSNVSKILRRQLRDVQLA